jgi:hypothetical protein
VKLKPSSVAYWALSGLILGLSVSQFGSATGLAFLVSQPTLIVTLSLIGLTIYLLTLPIYRYRSKLETQATPAPKRPNPFYAFRLLVLSRAVMLTGAGFAGWHLGQLVWLVSFSVSPVGLVAPTLFGLGGSALMLIGGMLAESNCRLPKDPDGESA